MSRHSFDPAHRSPGEPCRGSGAGRAPQPNAPSRRAWLGVFGLAGGTLLGCRTKAFEGKERASPRPAPEILGTNWDGKPFRLSERPGSVGILFFGYTFCPDICPLTLSRMKRLCAQLGDQRDEVDVIFVSVDPERDSEERLSQYVPAFDRSFIGLRLDGDSYHSATRAYEVRVRKGPSLGKSDGEDQYSVDHTGTIFLIDNRGRIRVTHGHDASVEQLLPDVKKLLAESRDA